MQVIKPPQTFDSSKKIIFLAGSIEMGEIEPWQNEVEQMFTETDWIVLNPRRDHWHSDWRQDESNPNFRQQVEWELSGLEQADYILMYFDPTSKSPISLLELGLYAKSGKLLVVCPDGFWRKGNIDLVCERYGVQRFTDLPTAVAAMKKLLSDET